MTNERLLFFVKELALVVSELAADSPQRRAANALWFQLLNEAPVEEPKS